MIHFAPRTAEPVEMMGCAALGEEPFPLRAIANDELRTTAIDFVGQRSLAR